MKRVVIIIVILICSTLALAQTPQEIVDACNKNAAELQAATDEAYASGTLKEEADACRALIEGLKDCWKQIGTITYAEALQVKDYPRLGKGDLGTGNALICYAINIGEHYDRAIEWETDPFVAWDLLKERVDATNWVARESSSGAYDERKTLRLGGNGINGETKATVNACEWILSEAMKEFREEDDPAKKLALARKIIEIELWCLKTMNTGGYDERQIPRLGVDHYRVADAYLYDCRYRLDHAENDEEREAIKRECFDTMYRIYDRPRKGQVLVPADLVPRGESQTAFITDEVVMGPPKLTFFQIILRFLFGTSPTADFEVVEAEESCGDDYCGAQEDCSSCSADCACAAGKNCEQGLCLSPACSENSACDDYDSCTTDICSYASTPGSNCEHEPILNCKGNDGCCPSGCNSIIDRDCEPEMPAPITTPPTTFVITPPVATPVTPSNNIPMIPLQPLPSQCKQSVFNSCMMATDLGSCYSACSLVEIACLSGDTPGATCYGAEPECAYLCQKEVEDGCLALSECTRAEIGYPFQ